VKLGLSETWADSHTEPVMVVEDGGMYTCLYPPFSSFVFPSTYL